MSLKFRATRREFTLSDDAGYTFDVVLVHDPEFGWSASAAFASHGFKTEQAALEKLKQSIKRFQTMLKETNMSQNLESR